MEVFVFDWLCLGKIHEKSQSGTAWRQEIGVVEKYTGKQKLGQNGTRLELFPKIHHIAALSQSPRVTVKIERNTREITGRIIFMSMSNDISWRSRDNKIECESNAKLFS